MLFATLDPTMRQINLPGIDKAILSDTVGFVSDLPHQLVAAFRATLEEVLSADLILHVRDIAHPDSDAQKDDVLDVLSGLGAVPDADAEDEQGQGQGSNAAPMIEIWNKADLIDDPERLAAVQARAAQEGDVALVSALTGDGIDALKRKLADILGQGHRRYELLLDSGDGAALAWLHAHGDVIAEEQELDGDAACIHLSVRMDPADHDRFLRQFRTIDG
jgi:GTP-binding protein HflX